MLDRRQFLAVGASGVAIATVGSASSVPSARAAKSTDAPPGFALAVQPGRVFKRSADQDRLQQDQWMFVLLLLAPEALQIDIEQLVVRLASGDSERAVTTYPKAVAAAMNLVQGVPAAAARAPHPVAGFLLADSRPRALAINRVTCELAWRTPNGRPALLRQAFPITEYVQRTELAFPFRGNGMITQGGAWNDGHRGRSGQFAIDAIGLTDRYAMMVGEGDRPEAHAGWGWPILAPAAGTVVVSRGDRPDQPVSGVSDPRYFAPDAPPGGGDPGNHCVIDHGNGEFSVIAHLRHGSLQVGVGDRVVRGQPLGQLGNSGDSTSPHLHHHLQAGPELLRADALPHVYVDGPMARHDRGTIFAKA